MTAEHFYRVDRIAGIPHAASDALLERVAQTHALLREQPGFVRDDVLVEAAPSGASLAIVTVVEWENEEVAAAVGARVRAMHERVGFDPAAFVAEHGATFERGGYRAARFSSAPESR